MDHSARKSCGRHCIEWTHLTKPILNGPILTLQNVTLPRGPVADLSVEFHPGTHLVVGPNGVGKTSLLNSIAGTLKPKSGAILMNGQSIAAGSTDVLLSPNAPPPIPWIRAGLLLEFIASLYPATRKDSQYQKQVVEQLGIAEFLNTNMGALSAGTAKKMLLAAAFVAAPPIMLFDEPTNEIDAKSVSVIMSLMTEASTDKILVITTHQPSTFTSLTPTILRLG